MSSEAGPLPPDEDGRGRDTKWRVAVTLLMGVGVALILVAAALRGEWTVGMGALLGLVGLWVVLLWRGQRNRR